MNKKSYKQKMPIPAASALGLVCILALLLAQSCQKAFAEPIPLDSQTAKGQTAKNAVAAFFENTKASGKEGPIDVGDPESGELAQAGYIVYYCEGYLFRFNEEGETLHSVFNYQKNSPRPMLGKVTSKSDAFERAKELVLVAFPGLFRTGDFEAAECADYGSGYAISMRERLGEGFYTADSFLARIEYDGTLELAGADMRGYSLQNASLKGLGESEAISIACSAVGVGQTDGYAIKAERQLTKEGFEWLVSIDSAENEGGAKTNFFVAVDAASGRAESR